MEVGEQAGALIEMENGITVLRSKITNAKVSKKNPTPKQNQPNKQKNSHQCKITAKYPLVESILSCTLLNYFHRGDTEGLACKAQREGWQGTAARGIQALRCSIWAPLESCRWGIHSQEFTAARGVLERLCCVTTPCRDLALRRHCVSVVQPHSDVPAFPRLLGSISAAKWKAWDQLKCWTSVVDVAWLLNHSSTLLSTHAAHF